MGDFFLEKDEDFLVIPDLSTDNIHITMNIVDFRYAKGFAPLRKKQKEKLISKYDYLFPEVYSYRIATGQNTFVEDGTIRRNATKVFEAIDFSKGLKILYEYDDEKIHIHFIGWADPQNPSGNGLTVKRFLDSFVEYHAGNGYHYYWGRVGDSAYPVKETAKGDWRTKETAGRVYRLTQFWLRLGFMLISHKEENGSGFDIIGLISKQKLKEMKTSDPESYRFATKFRK